MANVTVSPGLASWMKARSLSLAFTSYQFGELVLVGATPGGDVAFSRQLLGRAGGVAYRAGTLYLGSLFQLWRLENVLRPGELRDGIYDAVFMPRASYTTGDIDVHEIGIAVDGKPLLVNTKYNCLCALDRVHSFRPVWTPPFIPKLVAEDRCHVNGLAMEKGRARYVSALSQDNIFEGWRTRPRAGVLMDVESGRVVFDGLAMPHSPRLANGVVYVLESGRGFIVRLNLRTRETEDLAFCNGFLRGLAIVGDHAVVTVSKPRKADFTPHSIDDELKRRGMTAWCGVLVVDLTTGEIVEWIRIEGATTQLFDVIVLPGFTCAKLSGPEEMRSTVTVDPVSASAPPKRLVRA